MGPGAVNVWYHRPSEPHQHRGTVRAPSPHAPCKPAGLLRKSEDLLHRVATPMKEYPFLLLAVFVTLRAYLAALGTKCDDCEHCTD